MISNTSLQSFSVPPRSASAATTSLGSTTAAASRQNTTAGRATSTTGAVAEGQPASFSGARGTLLDRWA